MVESVGFPTLPSETPCFRIERFALDVPDALSTALKSQGASALPMDCFAFAREWLEHYAVMAVLRRSRLVLGVRGDLALA